MKRTYYLLTASNFKKQHYVVQTELRKEIKGKGKITSEMRTKLQGVEERTGTTENTAIP